jgi:cryptochrome
MVVATIHWFRKGLRIHDNPALLRAIDGADVVFPLFIIDPHFADPGRVGVNRYRFLLESLSDLDASLRTRYNACLFVARGRPEDVLSELARTWRVSRVTFEKDTEPYAIERDKRGSANITVESITGHTIWDPDLIIAANGGSAPSSYRAFISVAGKLPLPKEVPDPQAIPVNFECYAQDTFGIPTLEDMGYTTPREAGLYPGGETVAFERLKAHLARKEWVQAFAKPNTAPNSIAPSTTVLSPYLKFGCLSVRKFLHGLHAATRGVGKATKPPVSLEGQLLWREFFYTVMMCLPC